MKFATLIIEGLVSLGEISNSSKGFITNNDENR